MISLDPRAFLLCMTSVQGLCPHKFGQVRFGRVNILMIKEF